MFSTTSTVAVIINSPIITA